MVPLIALHAWCVVGPAAERTAWGAGCWWDEVWSQAMKSAEWAEIIRSAKQDDGDDEDGVWTWTCPECDEYSVEMGVRFERGKVAEYTLMCLSCEAGVVVPA